MNNRKVVLYISMSLDGFIATDDHDLSWLSVVEKEGEDYGYKSIQERSDAYIIGRKTYDVVLQLTGGDFPQTEWYDCYVITREERESTNGVKFYNGDIEDLIHRLKSEKGKDIYVDGGGQIVQLLMKKNLIDEYIISVIPIFLGDGKRLFLGDSSRIDLELRETKSFEKGLVQLHYTKKSY